MKWFFYTLAFFMCSTAMCQTGSSVKAGKARFYKAEGGVDANYLKLASDGTYRVVAREHMFVAVRERGRWRQSGSVITFTPSSVMRGGEMIAVNGRSYEGDELEYKGRTFIAFKTEDSAGIVIPANETKQQLEDTPQVLPLYVFFKSSANVFAQETKQTCPFRWQ
jgi:hypothetical protein